MASLEHIAATLRSVARQGMKPKMLRAAVRETHPEASRKEIVRAAFYALTEAPGADDAALADLHGFALSERGADDADSEVRIGKQRKKKRDAEREDRKAAN